MKMIRQGRYSIGQMVLLVFTIPTGGYRLEFIIDNKSQFDWLTLLDDDFDISDYIPLM